MTFVFVAGNLAMDFVGTLNERFAARVENLRDPADLSRWFVEAEVVAEPPPVTDDELAAAIELRELLFEVIARQIDARSPVVTAEEARGVNDAARNAPPVVVLNANGTVSRRGDVAACLSSVARDAIALFERDDGSTLKWCADTECTHPFLDHSRGQRRRWCGMTGCGDRAKAAAYRARRRPRGDPSD